jgi:hypothetical protein
MTSSNTIKRHADGSLDINYYLDRGRVERSRATIHTSWRFLDLVVSADQKISIAIKRIAAYAREQMPFPHRPVSNA